VEGYAGSLPRKLLNYAAFCWRAGRRSLCEPRPDVVFCFNTGPLTSAVPALRAGRRLGAPVVIWTQDVWPDSVWAYGVPRIWPLTALLHAFVRRVYAGCSRVLVSCAGFAAALAPFLPPEASVEHIPNWALELTPDAEPVRLSAEPRLQLAFAGNLGKLQNLDRVLDAWRELDPALRGRMQLNLIGDGSHSAALQSRAEAEGIGDLRFWGRVPEEQMAGWYAACDGLLVTLEDRPLFKLTVPSKFQTCLAAGKPVLAAVGGEVNRIVESEGVGLVADPGDTRGIRGLFERFAALPEAGRQAMADRARALGERDYDRRRILDRLEAVLREAAAEGR
jgi:glycosyltransferase involved in cell wall biosynthesis